MVVDGSNVCFGCCGGGREPVVEVGELRTETIREGVEVVVLCFWRFLLFKGSMMNLVMFQVYYTWNNDEPLM